MPRARGFILDGHGVFFDVEIPDMNQSLVWSVMMVQRDRQMGDAIGSLQTALKAMPAGPTLQQAQMALQAIEKTVGRAAGIEGRHGRPADRCSRSRPPRPRPRRC